MRGKVLLVLRHRRTLATELEEPFGSSRTSFLQLDFGAGDEVEYGANEDLDASVLLLRVHGERQKLSPKPLSADDVRGGSESH